MKISVLMMTFQGMEYLPYSLMGIYDFADEIIIVDGIIDRFNLHNQIDYRADGGSTDGTAEFIINFPDSDKKINYKVGRWKYEKEKRQYMLNLASGDWMFVVDIDEVYHHEQLNWIRKYLENNKKIKGVWAQHFRFCLDFKHYYQWSCNVLQRMYTGNKLFGLRDIFYPGHKVYKAPFKESRGITIEEYNTHLFCPKKENFLCYHYSNVCSKDKAIKKKAIAEGLGHNIKQWEADWFGVGISRKEYYKKRKICQFNGKHPEIMKTHPYYKNPPEWCLIDKEIINNRLDNLGHSI